MKSPIDYFSSIEDPRVDCAKDHLLSDIIFITIAAVICGAETWNDTIDAMGCQTAIAEKIIDNGADYLLAVKGNQGSLEQDAEYTIKFSKPVDIYEDTDIGHGRVETRTCKVVTDLSHIENVDKWKKLNCIVAIESTRYIKSTAQEQKETRLYITSLEASAKKIGESVRAHWGIENSLHTPGIGCRFQ